MKSQLVFKDTPYHFNEYRSVFTNNIPEVYEPLYTPLLDIDYDVNASNLEFRYLIDMCLYYVLCDDTLIEESTTLKRNLIINLLNVIGDKYLFTVRHQILGFLDQNKPFNTVLLGSVLLPIYARNNPCVQGTLSVLMLLMLITDDYPRIHNYDNIFMKNKCKSFLFRASGLSIILSPENEIKRDVLEIDKWLRCNVFVNNEYAKHLPDELWTTMFINRFKYLGLTTLLMLSTRTSTIPLLYTTSNQYKRQILTDILKGE